MKKIISWMCCIVMLVTLNPIFAFSETISDDAVVVGSGAVDGPGVLTDNERAYIRALIAAGRGSEVPSVLANALSGGTKETAVVMGNLLRNNGVAVLNDGEIAEGTTTYGCVKTTSGIFSFDSTAGIFSAIANTLLDMYITGNILVDTIWQFVYGVYRNYEPQTQMEASARTMYSYTYREETGYVYTVDGFDMAFTPRVTVISRDTYEHFWGQYCDVEGRARQATYDYETPARVENAPHANNSAWILSYTYELWASGLPYYYEDWTD